MCQQLSELQRLEFKEAFLEFDKVSEFLTIKSNSEFEYNQALYERQVTR